MTDGAPEQSMEDVLASIKRIISADVEAARRMPVEAAVPEDDVLELGSAPGPNRDEGMISAQAMEASKAALASLAGLSIDPKAADNTLDGLVREMLRPMLKHWLDANLPDLVERVVTREVARVIGR
jgi:cell pole-organizing protein PopZ